MAQEAQKVLPRSFAEIEREAEIVLKRFQPERLRIPGETDVMSLFYQLREIAPEAEYGVRDDLGLGVEGMVQPDGSVDVALEVHDGVLSGLPRPRWTMAHEIGHAKLHLKQIQRTLTDGQGIQLVRQCDCKPFENAEVQAHQFAAALLMPANMVVIVLRGVHKALWPETLMQTFAVSNEAAERRITYLKKLSLLK